MKIFIISIISIIIIININGFLEKNNPIIIIINSIFINLMHLHTLLILAN